MKDHAVPPPFSGLGIDAPRSVWDEHWIAYREALHEIHDDFSDFCRDNGAPSLPADDFIHESPWLNLYLYPEELDYPRARPLGPHWRNLEACVRRTDPVWDLPEQLAERPGPLLYLSLGSADGELTSRLIDALAGDRYRVIVAKGRRARPLDLPANMVGAQLLPQSSILPEVDLVISDGGTATLTECFYFGKPTVALPVSWDQHDNARRLEETGYGMRLDPHSHTPDELRAAIDGLLGDEEFAQRLEGISTRLQASPGTQLAANLIERAALEG
jgi:UDP:flavonoid glycosyltransferase YjiC (YdhE family)